MYKRQKSFSYINSVFFALCFTLFLVTKAVAQQPIVTDQQLNQRLIEFQTNFELNPPLVFGAAPTIELKGSSDKVSFVFEQKGRYDFSYGSIQFLPSSPISATRFITKLAINQVDLSGDAIINITKGKNTFDPLNCPSSKLSAVDVSFVTQVEFDSQGQLLFQDMKVEFDPTKIMAIVPCLDSSSIAQNPDLNIKKFLEEELIFQLSEDPQKRRKGRPGRGLIQITSMALQEIVKKPDSILTKTSADVANTNCTMVTTTAASACGVASLNNIKAIFADLSRIPNQNNLNAFKDALILFSKDLQDVSQDLSLFGQKTAQKFVDDLSVVILDGQISTLEQENLTASFSNLVLASTISNTQLSIIQNSLLTRLNVVSGVSTKQLQTDLNRLSSDVQPCLKP
ncbi:MAG: hypothetical protein FD167_1628 [bacterium]|nr:MAG: hypothetical protein FD167_1628 [bacterium]